ncbi:ABC transporter permease subunit [Cupriavidus basilensis]
MSNVLQGKTSLALLLALAIVFPLVTPNSYYLTVMNAGLHRFPSAIATLGLNLITGYTGQLNLAHGGFMAIGAYTLGILTVDHQVLLLGRAFVLSGVVCMAVGYLLGAWCRKVRLEGALLLHLHAVHRLHHLPADRKMGNATHPAPLA